MTVVVVFTLGMGENNREWRAGLKGVKLLEDMIFPLLVLICR